MKPILYAEHTKREGYCIDCIKHHHLSIHQLARNGDTCPMCDSLVFREKIKMNKETNKERVIRENLECGVFINMGDDENA